MRYVIRRLDFIWLLADRGLQSNSFLNEANEPVCSRWEESEEREARLIIALSLGLGKGKLGQQGTRKEEIHAVFE